MSSDKSLIGLMIEENVEWPEGVDYAAQDHIADTGNLALQFYKSRPKFDREETFWSDPERMMVIDHRVFLSCLAHDWNETVVTREWYDMATKAAKINKNEVSCDTALSTIVGIISRLTEESNRHKQEFDRCQSELNRLRQSLDDAFMNAGLKLTTIENQLNITDWRDLRVGDIIYSAGDRLHDAGTHTITHLEDSDYDGYLPFQINGDIWPDIAEVEWKFNRRPN